MAATAFAATKSIKVGDNFFVRSGTPPTVAISKGTKVTFKWIGNAPHNVQSSSGPTSIKSKVQSSGTFSKKFKKKGTYKLFCVVHDGMKMTLKVK